MEYMKRTIPYGKHFIDEDDIKAVENVLRHKNLTQGDEVSLFEKDISKYVGSKYAVAFSSWTAGLHAACSVIGITNNDSVITSPITFVATSNSVLYCGGNPIFSDISNDSINICPDNLESLIKKNPNVKAIIPVHFAGVSCDMEKIKIIADKYNLFVIEDAAHALGGKHNDGSQIGSCKFSDMAGFSFHPVKSIAAGEGGMITTNNEELYRKLLRFRSHGINKLDDKFIKSEDANTNGTRNPWYYEMQELGYNYRITDIQCALGRSQLKKLSKFIERRKDLVKNYDKAFKNLNNINLIQQDYRELSSHHLYVVRINFNKIKISRAEFMTKLRDKGIITQVHYIPVNLHPYYQKLGYDKNLNPNSLNYYSECLSIPIYYSLNYEEQTRVIKSIKKLINE